MREVEIRHWHGFCGMGAGAKGFNMGRAEVKNVRATFRCIGGADVSKAAIEDFDRIAGARGTVLDMFSREQYQRFHLTPPPDGWREATPDDIRRSAGYERPHIVFLSAPCKGFSGLLAQSLSEGDKYQALNELTLRGVWLMCEAWADDPPELVLFENVPRIMTRGRVLLDRIAALLRHYGYAVAETTHDCGELGNLAQSRKRFLLVARHVAKVPTFLYEPTKRPLRAVGDVLGRMPLPGDLGAGPMHRLPKLHWKTWVRLAFVEAGSDWRSLNRLAVEDGFLKDYAIAPAYNGAYGVKGWGDTADTVTTKRQPSCGPFSVADPRFDPKGNDFAQYGVHRFDETAGSIINVKSPGQGRFAVSDPRVGQQRPLFSHAYRVVRWDRAAAAVQGPGGAGGMAVSDPRPGWHGRYGNLSVAKFEDTSRCVIAGGKGVQGGWLSVADPRPRLDPEKRAHYQTAGHYGVVPFDKPAYAVTGTMGTDNGRGNVADPRLPAPNDKLACLIVAEDNTWHRPFTTLELAALQSIIDPEEHLELFGTSDSDWRERIGNAVPPHAAAAIASVMGRTLLLAWSGETFMLDSAPVWVRPIVAAIQCGSVA